MSEYKEVPTTTALISRMQVFEPTRRPKCKETGIRTIETAYGTATIKGRLGQAHADVLEAILYHIEDVVSISGESMTVIVNPHKVRVSAGGDKQFSGEQLYVVTKELMSAVIDIKTQNIKIIGHIIDTIEVIKDSNAGPLVKATEITNGKNNLETYGEKTLWKVTIGKGYLQIMTQDLISIRRDPVTIAKISTGISQAITRFCVTHSNTPNGGWKLDGLIEAVGGNGSVQTFKDRRREVRKDAPFMKSSGVIVDGNRVWLDGKI